MATPDNDLRGLNLRFRFTSVNYSLIHAGVPVLRHTVASNSGSRTLRDIRIGVAVPGYALPAEHEIAELIAGSRADVAMDLQPRWISDRLLAQTERSQATVQVRVNGALRAERPVWVLAASECSWRPGHERALAAFVIPNEPAITVLTRQTLEQLRDPIVDVVGAKGGIVRIADALYGCLRERHDIRYAFEPPSWESWSQRVRFPSDVVVGGRGTCWDLSLLVVAVLEQLLTGGSPQPLLLNVWNGSRTDGMHALVACWPAAPQCQDEVIGDVEQLKTWMARGDLFVMDSTGFSAGNPFSTTKVDFETNVRTGEAQLRTATRAVAVNLDFVRRGRRRVTPLPIRNEPSYDSRALEAFALARQLWREHPTEAIQGVHLLAGLLMVEGGVSGPFFETLSADTGNMLVRSSDLLAFLTGGLLTRPARPAHYAETSTFAAVRSAAVNEVRRTNAIAVGDLHLLMALLRSPSMSVTKALGQRQTSPKECLLYLELLNPAADTRARSTFPSAPELVSRTPGHSAS